MCPRWLGLVLEAPRGQRAVALALALALITKSLALALALGPKSLALVLALRESPRPRPSPRGHITAESSGTTGKVLNVSFWHTRLPMMLVKAVSSSNRECLHRWATCVNDAGTDSGQEALLARVQSRCSLFKAASTNGTPYVHSSHFSSSGQSVQSQTHSELFIRPHRARLTPHTLANLVLAKCNKHLE